MSTPAHKPSPFDPKAKFALVVDGNALSREALRAVLQQQGFLVVTAENGREAVEIAPMFPFSIILTNLQMPGMDGFEAVRRIRALGGWLARAPIAAVSPDHAEWAAAGLDAFMIKGSRPEIVLQTLSRLIQDHPLDPVAENVDEA